MGDAFLRTTCSPLANHVKIKLSHLPFIIEREQKIIINKNFENKKDEPATSIRARTTGQQQRRHYRSPTRTWRKHQLHFKQRKQLQPKWTTRSSRNTSFKGQSTDSRKTSRETPTGSAVLRLHQGFVWQRQDLRHGMQQQCVRQGKFALFLQCSSRVPATCRSQKQWPISIMALHRPSLLVVQTRWQAPTPEIERQLIVRVTQTKLVCRVGNPFEKRRLQTVQQPWLQRKDLQRWTVVHW